MATDAQATSAKTPLLMLMDGHAMVHRAWHAIQQPLTVRRTGEQVQGVLGFLNTFLWALGDLEPHVLAAKELQLLSAGLLDERVIQDLAGQVVTVPS